MVLDLNDASFEDLLGEGVPVHCAARLVEERKARPFSSWTDVLARCFYDWKVPQGRRSPDVRPAEQLLLMHVKGVSIRNSTAPSGSAGGASTSSTTSSRSSPAVLAPRTGMWWQWPEQSEQPSSGSDWQDDVFPAEFRACPFPEAMAVRVAGGPGAAPSLRLRYTFLYGQIEQVQGGPSPTFEFCGFELSKLEKAKLVARWAREYPELGEATLVARDVTAAGTAAPSGPGSATKPGLTPARKIGEAAGVDLANRLRSFRGHVWSQLRRLDGVVPATAVEIPDALQDMYRMDPFGNVVSEDAEPHSICYFEVEHLFPRRRGGLTVLQNLAAVQWHACRVRGGRLLAAIAIQPDGRNPLSCGLSDTMLQDVWSARARLPDVLQGTAAFRTVLSALLLTNWHRSDGRELLNLKTGLLHTTPPEQLFDALLTAFHVATVPLVSGWHLGLLVGLPNDPQASAAAAAAARKGGWPEVPPKAVLYRTFNQVLRLAEPMKLQGLQGLPEIPVEEDGAEEQGGGGRGADGDEEGHAAADGSSAGGLRRTRRRMATTATQTTDSGSSQGTDGTSGQGMDPQGKPLTVVNRMEAVGKLLMSTGGRQRKRLGDSLRPRLDERERPSALSEGGADVSKDQGLNLPQSAFDEKPSAAPPSPRPPPLGRTQSPQLPMTQSMLQAAPSTPEHEPGALPPAASPWAVAQFEATLGSPDLGTNAPPPVVRLGDVINSAGARYHPAMTGAPPRAAAPPPWRAGDADPLPKGLTLKELREDYSLPQWMTRQGSAASQGARASPDDREEAGPVVGPDGRAFWNPTFEPWRARRAAASATPLPDRELNSLQAQAVGQYASELYSYRSAHEQRYIEQELDRLEDGMPGVPSAYVMSNIHMRYAAGRAGSVQAAATAAAAAAMMGYGPGHMRPGEALGVPRGPVHRPPRTWLDQAALLKVEYGHAGAHAPQHRQRLGFGRKRSAPGLPEGEDVVRIAGSTASGSEGGAMPPPGRLDYLGSRNTVAIGANPRAHHPGMSGVAPPPAESQDPPVRGPELTVFDAFPDPLAHYDRFLQYHSWLQEHRDRMREWERRVDWEKAWYRQQSDFAVMQRAFLLAIAKSTGIAEPEVNDPWASLAASGTTGMSLPGQTQPQPGFERSFASGSYATLPLPEAPWSPQGSQLARAPSVAASVALSHAPSMQPGQWPMASVSPALSRVPSMRLGGTSPAASVAALRGQLLEALGSDAGTGRTPYGGTPSTVTAADYNHMQLQAAVDAMIASQQQSELLDPETVQQQASNLMHFQAWLYYVFQQQLLYQQQQLQAQADTQAVMASQLGLPPMFGAAMDAQARKAGSRSSDSGASDSSDGGRNSSSDGGSGGKPGAAGMVSKARGRMARAYKAAIGKLGMGKLIGRWGGFAHKGGSASRHEGPEGKEDAEEGELHGTSGRHEPKGRASEDGATERSHGSTQGTPKGREERGQRETLQRRGRGSDGGADNRGVFARALRKGFKPRRSGDSESAASDKSQAGQVPEDPEAENVVEAVGQDRTRRVAAAALQLAGHWMKKVKAPGKLKTAKPPASPRHNKDRSGDSGTTAAGNDEDGHASATRGAQFSPKLSSRASARPSLEYDPADEDRHAAVFARRPRQLQLSQDNEDGEESDPEEHKKPSRMAAFTTLGNKLLGRRK